MYVSVSFYLDQADDAMGAKSGAFVSAVWAYQLVCNQISYATIRFRERPQYWKVKLSGFGPVHSA